MEATSASDCCESLRLAPVSWTTNGTPRPSQIRWRLLPSFARSVGLEPVCAPQKLHESNNCPLPPVTNQSARSDPASPAKRNGSVARFQHLASRADAASRSSQNRSLVASETRPVFQARSSTFGLRFADQDKRLDAFPKRVR